MAMPFAFGAGDGNRTHTLVWELLEQGISLVLRELWPRAVRGDTLVVTKTGWHRGCLTQEPPPKS
jgi:hypothetical protein